MLTHLYHHILTAANLNVLSTDEHTFLTMLIPLDISWSKIPFDSSIMIYSKNKRKEILLMSKQSAPPICRQPDHIISYFSMQKGILAVITVSGLIYNLGLMARPWFEGQMIQCLFFIQKGQSHFSDMLKLASAYFIAILRYRSPVHQRLYVRRFANNITAV